MYDHTILILAKDGEDFHDGLPFTYGFPPHACCKPVSSLAEAATLANQVGPSAIFMDSQILREASPACLEGFCKLFLSMPVWVFGCKQDDALFMPQWLATGIEGYVALPVSPPEISFLIAKAFSQRHTFEAVKKLEFLEERQKIKRKALGLVGGIMVTDTKGIIIDVNQTFCKISGYPAEVLIGQPASILNARYHPTAFFEDLWATIRAGHDWQGEICNHDALGQPFWIYMNIVPVLDNNKPQLFYSINIDITARKRAEQQLSESVAIYRQLAKNLPQTDVYIFDSNLCFMLAEGREMERFGVEASYFEGKHLDDAMPRQMVDYTKALFLRCLQGEVINSEFQFLDTWFRQQLLPLYNDEGKIYAGILVVQNIQQQKLAEQARIDAYEALKATQAQLVHSEKMYSIGMLAAGIAHEINNPVNFVYAGINALKKNLNIVLDTKAGNGQVGGTAYEKALESLPKLLAGIEEGAIRTAETVKKLINFIKPTAHQSMQLHNLQEAITATLQLLTHQLGHITVVTELSEGVPPVRCVPGQINQVLLNVLLNAIHVLREMPENHVGKIRITTERNKDEAIITISDNGPGIPVEVKSRIFEPFFTNKPTGKGIGLGLSIASHIMEQHQGKIKLLPQIPGQGASFVIRIPIHQDS
jgi:PAS domain S-box-containing protein